MSEPKFSPGQSDYTLGDVFDAEKRATPVGQQLQIQSDSPIRCSAPLCRKDIKDGDAYMIVTTPRGTVVWHLWCMGIMRYGDFNDPAYAGLLRQRLMRVLG